MADEESSGAESRPQSVKVLYHVDYLHLSVLEHTVCRLKMMQACDVDEEDILAQAKRVFTSLSFSAHIQGGPAKVRPTYIFDGNI